MLSDQFSTMVMHSGVDSSTIKPSPSSSSASSVSAWSSDTIKSTGGSDYSTRIIHSDVTMLPNGRRKSDTLTASYASDTIRSVDYDPTDYLEPANSAFATMRASADPAFADYATMRPRAGVSQATIVLQKPKDENTMHYHRRQESGPQPWDDSNAPASNDYDDSPWASASGDDDDDGRSATIRLGTGNFAAMIAAATASAPPSQQAWSDQQ